VHSPDSPHHKIWSDLDMVSFQGATIEPCYLTKCACVDFRQTPGDVSHEGSVSYMKRILVILVNLKDGEGCVCAYIA
jgi:hypothetical protein